MKKILIALILIALIGGSVGYYMFTKPLATTDSMTADFTMSAADLLTVFEDDEAAANSKYLDKVITVQGQVEKVETEEGKVTIYLKTDNSMSNVIFQLEDSTTTINANEMVTLKGICTGYLMDVVMVRGVKI